MWAHLLTQLPPASRSTLDGHQHLGIFQPFTFVFQLYTQVSSYSINHVLSTLYAPEKNT